MDKVGQLLFHVAFADTKNFDAMIKPAPATNPHFLNEPRLNRGRKHLHHLGRNAWQRKDAARSAIQSVWASYNQIDSRSGPMWVIDDSRTGGKHGL